MKGPAMGEVLQWPVSIYTELPQEEGPVCNTADQAEARRSRGLNPRVRKAAHQGLQQRFATKNQKTSSRSLRGAKH